MGGGDAPLPEDNFTKNDHHRNNTNDNIEKKYSKNVETHGKQKNKSNKNLDYNLNNNLNNNQMNYYSNPNYNNNNFQRATSFYGQSMYPQGNGMPQMNPPMINMPQQQPMMQYPSFGVPTPYNYSGGIYQLNQPASNRRLSTKNPSNKRLNNMYKNTKYEDDCSIF